MIIAYIVVGVGLCMLLVEFFFPGRPWPKVKTWWFRAILLNSFQILTVFAGGKLWNNWLSHHRLWSSENMGIVGSGFLGYLIITFIFYWWHRFRHDSDFLWRWLHQIHHSAQRIEVMTSFYKHPFEILINSVMIGAVLYLGVGVTPEAAIFANILMGIGEMAYHWNISTPYWLGFFFQRPESHCIHHQDKVHHYNYSDLPLWDILFGTFRNPRKWKAKCGLGTKAEHRLKEMLAGKVVA